MAVGDVRDAGECRLTDVDEAGIGPLGPWYPPRAVPEGTCSAIGCRVEFNVNPCCNMPDTPELKHYVCDCGSDGAWHCSIQWQGAGYCGDGAPQNYATRNGCP